LFGQALLPSSDNPLLGKAMFCPFCNRQIKDDTVFCPYCNRAVTQKSSIEKIIQPTFGNPGKVNSKKSSARRIKPSNTAIRAVVTAVAIIVLVIVVLAIYYPGLLPWNW
jgi:uncharacterized membrane protein YvbJ